MSAKAAASSVSSTEHERAAGDEAYVEDAVAYDGVHYGQRKQHVERGERHR